MMLKTAPHNNSASPGPAVHSYYPEIGKDALKFTMRGRNKYDDNQARKVAPGPGSYAALLAISPSGKYVLTRMKDSGAARFSPSPNLNRTGKIFLSSLLYSIDITGTKQSSMAGITRTWTCSIYSARSHDIKRKSDCIKV